MRDAERGTADRAHRRRRTIPLGGLLRPPLGYRPDPLLLRTATQHRLDPGGDRQLNRALHTIAITAHHDPATRHHLAHKEAEGKNRKGALRCLKRHLARHFWHLLTQPPLDQHTTTIPALPEIPPRPAPRREIDHTITGPVPIVCIT